MENTSGQGPASVVPREIDRWNWGAFFLNWMWGIGNNTLVALLTFVPLLGLIVPFVLGAKGSEWAWRNKRWPNVEEFRRVQRQWAIWGVIVWVASIVFFGGLFFAMSHFIQNSDAYKLGLQLARSNPQVVQVLGEPITGGMPMGNINTTEVTGDAQLSIPVTGSHGAGKIYVHAVEKNGRWTVAQGEFVHRQSGQRISLTPPSAVSL